MKAEILKIAGVKSEKEFYKKYPTEEAFMKAHSKEFKKAKLGAAMAQDGWVQRAANAEFECKGHPRSNLRSEFSDGRTKAERKEDAAWDKEIAKQEAIEKKEIAAQKAQEWAEYINTGLDPYGEKYGRKDKTFSDSYNKFIAANPKFAEEQSSLGLSPEQRYAMLYKMAGRSGSDSFAAPQRLRSYMKLAPGSRFTDQQLYEATQRMGGIDKYADWWKSGYPEIQKYGGETKKLNQLTNFTNDVDDLIPMAQMGNVIGSYTGGDVVPNTQPIVLNDLYAQNISQLTGLSDEEARKQANLLQQPQAPKIDWKATMTQLGSALGSGDEEARKGKKVPKYQVAPAPIPMSPNIPNLSQFTSKVTAAPNIASGAPTGSVDRLGGFMGKMGGITNVANIAGDILGGIQGLKQEKQALINATATKNISDLTRRAASTRPEQTQRQYLRPEDALVQPNQLFPSYGVGTNFLSRNGSVLRAEDGMQIGGNLGEIQNTYAPGTLYDDLGYEPLNDSDYVKQYYYGGVRKAQDGNWLTQNAGAIQGVGNLATTALGGNNAGSQLGKGIGTAIGTAIPIPGLGAALGAVGGLAGGLLDKKAKKIEKAQKATQANIQATSMQQGIQALNAQNAGFVRNGGKFSTFEEGGWVSHDWQPQVITTFGEHKLSDLLRPDPTMDTLRSGGHLKQNYVEPSQRALDTMALGGELKTTWGGYAEPISYNPYMPGTGETVMFRGKSHDESDGNGHTGIGVKYGSGNHDSYTDYAEYGTENADADVEVERGEPATEMVDGQTGEKNMVVFGNLKIPNMFLNELGDPSAKGKKFKNYVADLGKVEARQNKIIEKATNKIDDLEIFTPFDKLRMDALQAMTLGANMKLKDIAVKKSNAAAIQNAINDTAAEHMIDADHLAKGKIKQDKQAMKEQAKYGKELAKAQWGWLSPLGYLLQNKEKATTAPAKSKTVTVAPPAVQLPTDDVNASTSPAVNTTAKKSTTTSGGGKNKSTTNSGAKSKQSGYVSKYGIKPWLGNRTGLGKKTASSFTTEEWDKVADTLGFKGYGNKEFEEFLLANPDAKKIIEKRHQDLYKKSPWIDPQHFGYGWAAPELKSLTGEQYEGEIPIVDINLPGKGFEEDGTTTTKETTKPTDAMKRSKLMDFANALLPYVRPSDQEAFDYAQVYPEMMAMAMNQLEPVKAQLYRPDLGTPMDISLQDQLNANQADFNALQRQVGYNPAALSALAAQKYAANQSVLGEQFRMNQAEKQRVYEGNRALLNQAQLQNLGILDQQFTRQEEAKSKTKAQAIEAMKSIADKIAQNKLENRTLGIYENLYNYRYDKSGRAINMNPLAQFDVTRGGGGSGKGVSGIPDDWVALYDEEGNFQGTKKRAKKEEEKNGGKVKKEARNGNIVKAIKNL